MFVRHDLREPGWVWDPTVHKYFGEDCYFILARLPDTGLALLQELEHLREDLLIPSFCFYTVHGYYDILIRLWSTQSAVDTLKARLIDTVARRSSVPPEDPVLFRVKKTFYDNWSIHDPSTDIKSIAPYEERIRHIAQTPESEVDITTIDELRKAKLLHEIDPSQHGIGDQPLIKLYVALQGPRAAAQDEDEIRRLRTVVANWQGVSLVSLYYGRSDGNDITALLKAVIPAVEYAQLYDALSHLHSLLKTAYLPWRTMTLLVANCSPYESDILEPEHAESHTADVARLVRLLSPEAGSRIYACDLREPVLALFNQYKASLLHTRFERSFLGVLEACIFLEPSSLEERLTFYFHVERWITRCLQRLFADQLGQHWPRELEALCKPLNTERKPNAQLHFAPGRSGLADLLKVAEALAKEGKIDLSSVNSALPQRWMTTLLDASTDRNDLAHGTLPKVLHDEGMTRWTSTAIRALEAGSVYNALAELDDADG